MGQRTISARMFTLMISCVVLLLTMVSIPAASLRAQQETPTQTHQALTPGVQGTPSVDPTLIALQKENLRHQNNWLWINTTPFFSVLAIVLTALFGLYRWRKEQHLEQQKRAEDMLIERGKRDEDRFQTVVAGLGSERVEAKVGAAIVLRTFLRPGYEQFYRQVFDLAVAHLRLRKADPNTPEPLDALSLALIIVLKESFPRARDRIISEMSKFTPELLDAEEIHLDNAYLSGTDLSQIRMRSASLRKAYFWKANLKEAYLKHSNLQDAFLVDANLEEADLGDTVLARANLTKAHVKGAHLRDADLTEADFTGADLTGTHPEGARSLHGTILHSVSGLTADQLAACAAKGAIVDGVHSP